MTRLAEAGYLLDVEVLSALVLRGHPQNGMVAQWFAGTGSMPWGTCVLTEAGFLRVTTDPRAGGQTMEASREALAIMARHPRHHFWPLNESCDTLTAPLSDRLFGHQHLTDALLLGLAIHENGILVTMDRSIRHLAGSRYKQNLLLLEPNQT